MRGPGGARCQPERISGQSWEKTAHALLPGPLTSPTPRREPILPQASVPLPAPPGPIPESVQGGSVSCLPLPIHRQAPMLHPPNPSRTWLPRTWPPAPFSPSQSPCLPPHPPTFSSQRQPGV